jgi:integrase
MTIAASHPNCKSQSLLDWIERTYAPEHVGIDRKTIGQYLTTARLLNQSAGRVVRVDELSRRLAVDFQQFLLTHGRSLPTIASKRRNLFVLWRYAHSLGAVAEKVPVLSPIKLPKRKPKAWQLAQMEALIQSCYATPSRRAWEARHWVALVMVIYDTGLRISACLELATTQLCLSRGVLRVEAEQQKDDEEMVIGLHPQTVACLHAALESPRDLIFPWPFSKREIWPQYRVIVDRAGLPSSRRDLFHKIRRTSASWLESVRPGAATSHLGHGDRKTTEAYLDPEITGTCVNAAELLPRFNVAVPKASPQLRLFTDEAA